MDPISAAGIGLSAVSLALQVFAGCVKAYQIFADAQGMPSDYQHHRVRLRIEQTRLLNWGEKVGLVKELLNQPSHVLQLHRNLVIDILLEVQALFKDCVAINAKYENLVTEKPLLLVGQEKQFDRRFPKGINTMLSKTLSFLERAPEMPQRLMWVMVREEKFTGMIEKLIGYNDTIESLLDRNAIDSLQGMQHQMYMAMLQLNVKVEELKEISLAMKIETKPPVTSNVSGILRSPDIVKDQLHQNQSFRKLAEFKAYQISLESKPEGKKFDLIDPSQIDHKPSGGLRSEAVFQGKRVWIEWKNYTPGPYQNPGWAQTIKERVKNIAILLSSQTKPEEFRAPLCLGYFDDKGQRQEQPRYGFLYGKPDNVPPETQPLSLLHLIVNTEKASLTKRVALAYAIARCLMYLHSVNWLHKGLRSNNIIFFAPYDQQPEYSEPVISGFDYARPDLSEEATEPLPEHSEYDIYRHPESISPISSRSKKSHDIYSLGIVLVEIAYWQPVDDIVGMPPREQRNVKEARRKVQKVRGTLLEEKILQKIEASAGRTYRQVVQKCLTGGKELGVVDGAEETNAEVGACMQSVLENDIVNKLGGLRV